MCVRLLNVIFKLKIFKVHFTSNNILHRATCRLYLYTHIETHHNYLHLPFFFLSSEHYVIVGTDKSWLITVYPYFYSTSYFWLALIRILVSFAWRPPFCYTTSCWRPCSGWRWKHIICICTSWRYSKETYVDLFSRLRF